MIRRYSCKLKDIATNYLLAGHTDPIIVASMGRSGSTMLYTSIVKASAKQSRFGSDKIVSRLLKESAWDLETSNLTDGYVYKTHDYPLEELKEENVRCLYTYSDPYKVIPSLINKTEKEGKQWLKEHARHLQTTIEDTDELFESDVLNLQKNFEAWTSVDHLDVLAVRYDSLWKYEGKIADFIGIELELPERKERNSSLSDLNEIEQDKVKQVYRGLRERVMDKEMVNNY